MIDTHSIEDSIYNYPLSLLDIKSEKVIRTIDKYLPYSTGFEIECNQLDGFNDTLFRQIPNIIDVNCDSDEQRFRIPSGLKGMICLYRISKLLKEYCSITQSGIHYHVDMTSWFGEIDKQFIAYNKEWILEELDTWEYVGTYNIRDCKIDDRCWVQFQTQFKTAEFRIGEMSFDYELLIRRIFHCNKIVRRLKGELYKYKEQFRLEELKYKLKELEELKYKLKELEEEDRKDEVIIPSQEELNNLIKNRVIRNGRSR